MRGGEGGACDTLHCNSMAEHTLGSPLSQKSIYRVTQTRTSAMSVEGVLQTLLGKVEISLEMYLIITL